ncbi:MAG: hypothetical protein NT061_00745 [Spirochaetes bacterium]|nr:hypothetical protein [Spirochaetota bacterium]
MCDVTDVEVFLARLVPLLENGRLYFQPRSARKTREFMSAERLAVEDVFEIIGQLEPEHYHWGPRADDDGSPGEVWLFYYPYAELFPPFERILLYIKLKIWIDADGDVGIVMSFHDEGNI